MARDLAAATLSLPLAAHCGVEASTRVLDATIWIATGDAPQLVAAHRLPTTVSRRVFFELDVVCPSPRAARPRLAFDYGEGFREAESVALAPSPRSAKPWSAEVDLAGTPRAIRMDPGCGAGAFLCSELRATPMQTSGDPPPPRLAALVHLSRAELWPEMSQYLGNIASLDRLYLSMDRDAPPGTETLVRARFPEAVVMGVEPGERPHAGLEMLQLAIDHGMDLACVLHTRPCPIVQGGDPGRWDTTHKLVGSAAIVAEILAAFTADPTLGIVVPSGYLLPPTDDAGVPWIGGGMCWARVEALGELFDQSGTAGMIEMAARAAATAGLRVAETSVGYPTAAGALDFAPLGVAAALRGHVRVDAASRRPLSLATLAGVQPVDPTRGLWHANHNDPQFLLEGLVEHAGRWVAITLAQRSPFSLGLPTIHFDFGDGWTLAGAALLQRPKPDGREQETVCLVPPGARRARFDPTAFPGEFTIGRIAVRPLSAVEATAHIAAALGEPDNAPLALSRLFPAYVEWLTRLDASYSNWLRHYDVPESDHARLRSEQEAWREPPTITIFAAASDEQDLAPLMQSLRAQVYPHWEIQHAPASADGFAIAANAALARAGGRLFAMARAGDTLHPLALHFIARAAVENPGAALVYTDEDRIGPDGARRDPLFKCAPNAELLLACDMFGSLACYDTAVLRQLGGLRDGFAGAERHELALRVVEAVDREQVVHVPRVLYHRSAANDVRECVADAACRAVAGHLQRSGAGGEVMPAPGAPAGMVRVRFAMPDPAPTVAIIVPTRDHAALLRTCVESLRSRTTYPAWTLHIVDNGSREPEALDLLASYERGGITIIRDDSPFNYSALNNRAVAATTADFVCLLNNDIEVLSPDWLEEMVAIAARPGVGAVGARLWYPDRTLQHGGLVVGIAGYAGYAHKHLPQGEAGYASRAILHQQFTAVTGACLVVRKPTYEAVGGLDEALPVAFNDVDFCLRLFDAGYRNVWTPYAELVHHESASRGADSTAGKVRRLEADMALLRSRWGARLFADPAYSPNLTLDAEDFSLAWPPRTVDSP